MTNLGCADASCMGKRHRQRRRQEVARQEREPARPAAGPALDDGAVVVPSQRWPWEASAIADASQPEYLVQEDPVKALGRLRRLPGARRRLDREQEQLVRLVRVGGVSWVVVGRALGVSAQAVAKRYGPAGRGTLAL